MDDRVCCAAACRVTRLLPLLAWRGCSAGGRPGIRQFGRFHETSRCVGRPAGAIDTLASSLVRTCRPHSQQLNTSKSEQSKW
jgi:hypothetical protein